MDVTSANLRAVRTSIVLAGAEHTVSFADHNKMHDANMDKLHNALKAKGYKKTSGKSSALAEHTFKKGSRTIDHSTWHGEGNYGKIKASHTLHDSASSGKHGLVHSASHNDGSHVNAAHTHVTPAFHAAQKEHWNKLHEYVAKHA